MNTSFNSIIRLHAILLLLLGLSACGPKQELTSQSSSDSATPSDGTNTTTEPKTIEEKMANISGSMNDTQLPPEKPIKYSKLIKVKTIEGADANSEFLRNKKIVETQRANIATLQHKIETATSEEDKKKLQEDFDTAYAKLNENNAKMTKAYQYTLNRDYKYVIEKSAVYMSVTPEEARKYEAHKTSQLQQKNARPE